MTSWLKTLNDNFVTVLRGMISTIEAEITGEWVIEVERDKLQYREIRVAPAQREVTSASRGLKKKVAVIQCLIVDPLREQDEIESAQLLVDRLEELLNSKVGSFTITKIEQPIVLDTHEFRTEHKLSSTVIFTFEGIE